MPSLRSRIASTFVAIATACSTTTFAQNFDKVEIKIEKLSPTTYLLVGAGGNTGLSIGEDTVFMVDGQYGPLTQKIMAAIKTVTDKPVQYVVNTHWHIDHVGGNENFRKAGALIVAHDNVRKRLASDQFLVHVNRAYPPAPELARPNLTFSNDVTFHLNGDEIFVFNIPNAHTDGDAIVHFRKSNVVHMGDNLWHNIYPVIDSRAGGTPEGMIAVADRVLSFSDDKTRIIPGHGPLASRADLKAYRDMLATTSARVKALAKDGKKLDDVIAAKPTAEFDERWGKGFFNAARYIELLFRAYTDPGFPAVIPWPSAPPVTTPAK